jgi:hypothetical protein
MSRWQLAIEQIVFQNSEELVRNSGLPASALIDVGKEPLEKLLKACETISGGD